ncbi:MAG: phosphatidate cytidylyltransferase [Kiritimatiellales bacterium]
MAMDKKRIVLGLLIAAVIAALLLLVPSGNLLTLIALLLICAIGMHEFYRLIDRADLPASYHFGIASGIAFVAMTWFVCRAGVSTHILWALLVLILLINFCRILAYPDAKFAIRNALGTLFGFIYVAFFWSFFVRIFMLGPKNVPAYSGLYFLLAVKWGDAGAYFLGCRFGKHKLFPRISPKKSWEGLFGGMLASCIIGALWWYFSDATLGSYRFPLYHALILGILFPVVGTLGDLMESLFKRAVDAKDSGTIAHGLGGILDMIDSILFAAPFLYMYIEFFFRK